jgi:catecholate siderophore receptor
VQAGYEYFSDDRTVDRGVPSYQGRPSPARITTFFGNPDSSYASARVSAGSALVEHWLPSGITVRNRTHLAGYEKAYLNSLPGAVTADGTQVALSAYGNTTDRRNLFNQTDVSWETATGALRHTLLAGAEFGRQETENFRRTGYYNNTATSFAVPFSAPTVGTPITFRQSASDADNGTVARVASFFVQDQVELGRYVQAIGGVRWERFDIGFHDNRTDQELSRRDEVISPRAGLVFKPVESASLYGSYSVSFLPSSGEQFSSLSATSATLKPEQFTNYEVGAKWDVVPGFSLTSALYRLDRTNTTAPDPTDPKRVVQTGEQRTTGVEFGASGNVTAGWQMVGGAAFQRARITSTTTAAAEGKRVPLVPERTLSLWNRLQLHPAVGVGLGVIHQSEMFAAIDNTVTLPGFTRTDAALFLRLAPAMSAQVNVENLMDRRYYSTSHGNNNIMPGASRTVRFTLTTRR